MQTKIDLWKTDQEVIQILGLRLKNLRLKANITQQDLAKELALSEGTIRNIEKGQNISLENFIRIVRFFSEIDKLDSLFQLEEISPKELFESRTSKTRKRASK